MEAIIHLFMQQSLFGLAAGINILPFDGEALFYPGFLSETESEAYFNHILHSFTWKQEQIKLYDKWVLQPRLTAFCGDLSRDLEYSEKIIRPQPWTEMMLDLKLKTEALCNHAFTHALFNLYRDGKDSVSWHRDKVKNWGYDPVIASISLGAARTFQFRNYQDKSIVRSLELTAGCLLLMKGTTQRYWEHQIPKTTRRIGPRINITFRVLI